MTSALARIRAAFYAINRAGAKTIVPAVMVLFSVMGGLLWVLSTQYPGRSKVEPTELAHVRAVNTFVKSKGFGRSRLPVHKSLWNDRWVLVDGKRCEVMRIELIGLTDEFGDRYFDGFAPPRKTDFDGWSSRDLSYVEIEAIVTLRSGEALSQHLPPLADDARYDEAFRLMAPLRAREQCLDCHQVEKGELLGAFAYSLHPRH